MAAKQLLEPGIQASFHMVGGGFSTVSCVRMPRTARISLKVRLVFSWEDASMAVIAVIMPMRKVYTSANSKSVLDNGFLFYVNRFLADMSCEVV